MCQSDSNPMTAANLEYLFISTSFNLLTGCCLFAPIYFVQYLKFKKNVKNLMFIYLQIDFIDCD